MQVGIDVACQGRRCSPVQFRDQLWPGVRKKSKYANQNEVDYHQPEHRADDHAGVELDASPWAWPCAMRDSPIAIAMISP